MLVTTIYPMSSNDISNIDDAPYTIESEGSIALKIYFRRNWIDGLILKERCISNWPSRFIL